MSNLREMKIEAVAKAVEHGASEADVRRLAPEQGCDTSVIEAGLRQAAKRGFKGDPQMNLEIAAYEQELADLRTADAESACRVQGPDAPIAFWHPALPEVIETGVLPTSLDVHTKTVFTPTMRHLWPVGASSVVWGHLRRSLTSLVLLLSALLPLAASAQQAPAPCKVNVQSGTAAGGGR